MTPKFSFRTAPTVHG